MKKAILTLLSIIAFSVAGTFAADMKLASDFYYRGEYRQAINVYDSICAGNQESADLYYNLGNSYLKLYQQSLSSSDATTLLAKAILNYERSLKMNPSDSDVKFNLEYARKLTVDKIDAPQKMVIERWASSVRNITTSQNWAIISIILFVIMLAALVCYIFSKIMWVRKTGLSLSVVLLVLSIVTFVISVKQKNFHTDSSFAIITSVQVNVADSPEKVGESSQTLLHAGTKVKVLEYVGSSVEIETENGDRGWVSTDTFEII